MQVQIPTKGKEENVILGKMVYIQIISSRIKQADE